MTLLTKELDDSMSLNDIQYLKNIIKTGKDEYPLDDFYDILKSNYIFSKWHQKTDFVPIKIDLKDIYNKYGITYNGAINIYIKNHIDNNYKVFKGKLTKLSQIVQQKNNFRHITQLNDILIRKLVNKEITPFEFVIQSEKFKFEGLIYRIYFNLLLIKYYINNNLLSLDDNKKILKSFLKRNYGVINILKQYYKLDKIDLDKNIEFLEDILKDEKRFLEIYALFIENEVNKAYFKEELKKANFILI
jgi:hypothetical protein